MAAQAQNRILTSPDMDFIARFVYDVVMGSLRTCGFNKPVLVLNSRENVYSRPNFVRTAVLSVLRMSMSMRDEWRATFRNLPRESVYDAHFFSKHLSPIVKMGQEEGEETLQFNVEITLAMCNEMALFFTSQNIPFNLLHLIGAATTNIMCLIESPLRSLILSLLPNSPRPDFKQELQKLFNDFENTWELARWLDVFIQRYAVPYGSRTNVSRIFYREVKKRWENIVRNECGGRQPSVEKVKVNLGFLPKDVYDEIAANTPMPSYSEVKWGRKPSKSTCSEKGAVGSEKSGRRRTGSGSVSKQAARGGKDPSKQATQGGKDPSKQATQGGKDPSKQATQGGKDPSKQATQGGKDPSKQATQGGKDSLLELEEDFSRMNLRGQDSLLEIEEGFSRMTLGAEGSSQASQGAISKR